MRTVLAGTELNSFGAPDFYTVMAPFDINDVILLSPPCLLRH